MHTIIINNNINSKRLLYEHQGADVFGKRRRLENFELGKAIKVGCSSLDKKG
jgi:hypothetical protein